MCWDTGLDLGRGELWFVLVANIAVAKSGPGARTGTGPSAGTRTGSRADACAHASADACAHSGTDACTNTGASASRAFGGLGVTIHGRESGTIDRNGDTDRGRADCWCRCAASKR